MLDEIYFFTFTNGFSRYIHIYMAKTKNKWLDHLKVYYAYTQNKSEKAKPIQIICTDKALKLKSTKADNWMCNESIFFEPSALYSQEQNGISKQMD